MLLVHFPDSSGRIFVEYELLLSPGLRSAEAYIPPSCRMIISVLTHLSTGPAGSYGRQLLDGGGESLKLQPWQIGLGLVFTLGALAYIGRIAKDVSPLSSPPSQYVKCETVRPRYLRPAFYQASLVDALPD